MCTVFDICWKSRSEVEGAIPTVETVVRRYIFFVTRSSPTICAKVLLLAAFLPKQTPKLFASARRARGAAYARSIRSSIESRFSTIFASVSASRFSRSTGSVFDGRRLNHQSL